MEDENVTLEQQYDDAINKIQQLNQLLGKLANKESLEDLADQTTPEDYMNLLCNSFSLISLSYLQSALDHVLLYAHKRTVNARIKKVKQYYSKVKDVLAGKLPKKQTNPLQVDKDAAMRMIKAGIRQQPGQK